MFKIYILFIYVYQPTYIATYMYLTYVLTYSFNVYIFNLRVPESLAIKTVDNYFNLLADDDQLSQFSYYIHKKDR